MEDEQPGSSSLSREYLLLEDPDLDPDSRKRLKRRSRRSGCGC
jgi:hypothetical protein